MTDYRIRKHNARNWVIEEFIPSQEIKVGKYKGGISKSKWKIDGYYGKIKHLCIPLLERHILEDATIESVAELKQLIKDAELKILTKIEEIIEI